MRRSDREMSLEDSYALLERANYGILATVCEDGTPYGLPISYAFDRANNCLYMHCSAAGGQNLANIRHNPHATFTVVGETQLLPMKFSTKYESVIVNGTIQTAQNEARKVAGLEAILLHLAPQNRETGMRYISQAKDRVEVLVFEINSITGKHRV